MRVIDHFIRKPVSPEDLLEAGVLVYLSGLGLHGR